MKCVMALIKLIPNPVVNIVIGMRLNRVTDKKLKAKSNLTKASEINNAIAVYLMYLQWYLPSLQQYTTVNNSKSNT